MIAVDGFETARLRAEPIGPRHRDALIALLGDERVGATLGGVAGPAAVDERIAGWTAVSFTLPDNVASRRVMEKLGFRFERDTPYAGLPHVLYRLRVSPA